MGKKLTYAERKLKQKKDEKHEQNEYKKNLRIIKEIIRRLGGHVHSTTSPSPEPNGKMNEDNDDEEKEKEEEEDESFNRDIVLRFCFESLAEPKLVVGAMCAIGRLCKVKHN